MSRDALEEVLWELTPTLRRDVQGYVSAVDSRSREIFVSASIQYTDELAERFLFIVGIRRVWTRVAGEYWLLENSLGLTARQGIAAIRVGTHRFARDAKEYRDLRDLHGRLSQLLRDLGIWELVDASTPAELLRRMTGNE